MHVSIRGGPDFWNALANAAERARDGHYTELTGSESSDTELRLTLIPGEFNGWAVLVTDVENDATPWCDYPDMVEQ